MKGIILNSEMVNTILDKGVLKYRKAIKVQPNNDKQLLSTSSDGEYVFMNFKHPYAYSEYFKNPIGYKGDMLFVKEDIWNNDGDWEYSADDTLVEKGMQDYCSYGHLPPYRMRQDQSRLTVEITDTKAEKADVWEWVVNLKLIK